MSESTALIAYEKIIDPLAYVKEAGTIIAKSRMFGCQTVEQGQALALIGLTENLPMLELRRRYHIIDGELVMRAEYMRAEFRRMGGKYRWIKDGEDGQEACIWVQGPDEQREVSYTIADAKREGLIKSKSRWEKAPGDMLRARCSTKAIRMVASEVLAGFYADEELGLEAKEPDGSKTESQSSATVVEAQPSAAAPVTVVNVSPNKPGATVETVDAEFEAKAAASNPAAAPQPQQSQPEFCTAAQREQIESLFLQAGATPDKQQAILQKRGVNSLRSLTPTQADELIGKLTEALVKQKQQANAALPEVTPGSEPAQYSVCGPCTPDQEQRIKAKLMEWKQVDPAAYDAAMNGFTQKLFESGRRKIIDLSANDAARLYDAIQTRSLASFLQRSLEDWKPKELPPPPAEEPSKFVQSLAEMQGEQKDKTPF